MGFETILGEVFEHADEAKAVADILRPLVEQLARQLARDELTADDIKAIAKGAMLLAARTEIAREQAQASNA